MGPAAVWHPRPGWHLGGRGSADRGGAGVLGSVCHRLIANSNRVNAHDYGVRRAPGTSYAQYLPDDEAAGYSQVFPRHTHDTFAIGVNNHGTKLFYCEGSTTWSSNSIRPQTFP